MVLKERKLLEKFRAPVLAPDGLGTTASPNSRGGHGMPASLAPKAAKKLEHSKDLVTGPPWEVLKISVPPKPVMNRSQRGSELCLAWGRGQKKIPGTPLRRTYVRTSAPTSLEGAARRKRREA